MKKAMKKELIEKWCDFAKLQVKACMKTNPAEIYILTDYLMDNLKSLDLSPDERYTKENQLAVEGMRYENTHGPSRRWLFHHIGFTSSYRPRLKMKVRELGVFMKLEQYTLRELIGPDEFLPDIDEQRIFGYILTRHPCRGRDIEALVETDNFKMMGIFTTIEMWDDALEDGVCYGPTDIHDDEMCRTMNCIKVRTP